MPHLRTALVGALASIYCAYIIPGRSPLVLFQKSPHSSPTMTPPSLTVGALEIGVIISTFLFGISTVQTHTYFRRFPRDGWIIKCLVCCGISGLVECWLTPNQGDTDLVCNKRTAIVPVLTLPQAARTGTHHQHNTGFVQHDSTPIHLSRREQWEKPANWV